MKRLIKNENDYEMALSRIERLMDAEPDTEEMDELELLTALVEMYEDRHYPIRLPDPVSAIKFRMDQLGLTQKDMAPYFGSKSRVSEILNGKRQLTLAMMRALNKILGISAEVLLKEPGGSFPEEINGIEWQRFPVVEMAKRCWLPKEKNLKENIEEIMRALIDQAGGFKVLSGVLLRQGRGGRYNSKMDQYALVAWCIQVMVLARKNSLETKHVKDSVNTAMLREVARLSYFKEGPLLAKEYLEKHGIQMIVLYHLPKTYLDGAAMLMPDGTPVIGLTLRYDRIDNFWFCLLHELAHVAKHLSTSDSIIIDDFDIHRHDATSEDKIEKEADTMAQDGLIPKKEWQESPVKNRATASNVLALANKLKIHPAIIAGRVRRESDNYRLLSKYVGSGEIRKHFSESCS
jgi:HTH-type transcriptional regulator / antitoxin HigA